MTQSHPRYKNFSCGSNNLLATWTCPEERQNKFFFFAPKIIIAIDIKNKLLSQSMNIKKTKYFQVKRQHLREIFCYRIYLPYVLVR